MTTIKETANAYIPKKTKNIADLDRVDVNMEMEEREGIDENNEKYEYQVAVIEGEEYRVPPSVLGLLQGILQKSPHLKIFSVSKTGEGKATRYSVIPIE